MNKIYLVQLTALVLLLAPGVAIGMAWWRFYHLAITVRGRTWTSFNFWLAIMLTTGYLYFLSIAALLFSPWSKSFFDWPLYRNGTDLAAADLLTGLLGAALAFFGRGAARIQLTWAGLLLSVLSVFALYGMVVD